ncbi:pentapeptide repeat-containing protein [Microbacterium sp. CFBP 8790]|uniref:pentapeptide repeat-containing protein n=1 Tax=unclassified Microbacterium TaxID=2609290 RepID=UPI001781D7FE|nr:MULTISPECIES: pentapeptide repeat-containing protein [unclassified Microbacterium]MBD8205675.1 pentapeptide repeat-containing protein [Microbacterium sp. CFBP 8801]MBD8507988.1 pentapeptide repeat-containing protein [Microbacterium sp. CFBP 8790]
MPKPPALVAPSFDRPPLDDLDPGEPAALVPRAALEGLSFRDLRLDGLDLESAELTLCRIEGLRAPEVTLRYAHVSESALSGWDVPIVRSARTTWRDVEIEGSRTGSLEAYESTWNGVHFVNCRLGFVNLRGSHLQDVAFTDCTIDELDLGQSKLTRFAANGTRISQLIVEQATLQHTDLRGAELEGLAGLSALRGATISSMQVQQLAPLLAADRGITVRD